MLCFWIICCNYYRSQKNRDYLLCAKYVSGSVRSDAIPIWRRRIQGSVSFNHTRSYTHKQWKRDSKSACYHCPCLISKPMLFPVFKDASVKDLKTLVVWNVCKGKWWGRLPIVKSLLFLTRCYLRESAMHLSPTVWADEWQVHDPYDLGLEMAQRKSSILLFPPISLSQQSSNPRRKEIRTLIHHLQRFLDTDKNLIRVTVVEMTSCSPKSCSIFQWQIAQLRATFSSPTWNQV